MSGNAVFVRTARGTVVRDRVTPRDPKTPALREVRAAQGRAARAWPEMEPEAVARWTAWAKAQPHPRPSPGGGETMRPMNAFTNLYKVLLRLDPLAPVPLFPPARPFFGDVIGIEVSLPLGRGRGGVESIADGFEQGEVGSTPTLPSPRGEEAHSIGFAASGANAPGVVTELLVQPLASRHRRTYLEKYRHAAYVAFAEGQAVAVPFAAGWVACAYRFVNAETGQVTALAELGVVRV